MSFVRIYNSRVELLSNVGNYTPKEFSCPPLKGLSGSGLSMLIDWRGTSCSDANFSMVLFRCNSTE
jgi:hypothetical protein